MKNKSKKICRRRHNFWFSFFRPGVVLLFKLKYGFKRAKKYKIKKGENIIVLSNHQTDADGVLVSTCFNKALHIVCTDSITTNGFVYKLLDFISAPIPIRKGSFDPRAISNMMQVAKEGGNILLFPEGNRTYAEFQYDIGMGTVKLIKKLNITLVLFKLIGGTGTSPRFAHKHRRGHFEGKVAKVLKPEEYQQMSNEELYETIMDSIRSYDSEGPYRFKSKAPAEYLERMLYVCPKCGKVQTLVSKGDTLKCTNCGLQVKFTNDLHLVSEDPEFKFNRMVDWYNYQKEWTRNYEIPNEGNIFTDDYAEIYTNKANEKRKLVSKGKVTLTKDLLTIGDISFDVTKISSGSPISGKNFNFNAENNCYLVKGSDRFNPLKYIFMFNRLDTIMKQNKTDKYYSIDE